MIVIFRPEQNMDFNEFRKKTFFQMDTTSNTVRGDKSARIKESQRQVKEIISITIEI